ncbi:hypothetical protein C0J45_9862 [Silurus meridionalis]|nr:hypothetical protein C0J45_9862 [Silurus meridionalis]
MRRRKDRDKAKKIDSERQRNGQTDEESDVEMERKGERGNEGGRVKDIDKMSRSGKVDKWAQQGSVSEDKQRSVQRPALYTILNSKVLHGHSYNSNNWCHVCYHVSDFIASKNKEQMLQKNVTGSDQKRAQPAKTLKPFNISSDPSDINIMNFFSSLSYKIWSDGSDHTDQPSLPTCISDPCPP